MSDKTEMVLDNPQELVQALPMPTNEFELLAFAIKEKSAIDVIERISALRERARDYQAKVDFDEALNRCQAKLSRISADTPGEKGKYASYAKLDRIIRPIYTSEGFSISYGERDCPTPGKTRYVAYVSRSGQTREYLKDMTPSTKGPKGNDVMTPIHSEASADSYAKRYLLKDIFNVAIGEDDNDGCGTADKGWLQIQKDEIGRCETLDGLQEAFTSAANKALNEVKDMAAYQALKKAKEERKKILCKS